MRTREQVSAEVKLLGAKKQLTRAQVVLFEVLLDIRDGLYEESSKGDDMK